MSTQAQFRIAVLDDYQNVALTIADWSVLDGRASVTVFNDHLAEPDAVVARLSPTRSSRACNPLTSSA
jgi:hypothetical protein